MVGAQSAVLTPDVRFTDPSASIIRFNKRVALVTGGFDPIHSGHIALLNAADDIGDKVCVGINSDMWLERKKGKYLLPADERKIILESMKVVDKVIEFNDDDDSATEAIKLCKHLYPGYEIVFCNGGDRNEGNIPEMTTTFDDVKYMFGVGGVNKQNSSSWITDRFTNNPTEKERRRWGWYRVLMERDGVKVKELKVDPGAGMSLQRHFKREELWWVFEGKCDVRYNFMDDLINVGKYQETNHTTLEVHDTFKVPVGGIHQIFNPYDVPCRIIEFQYGEDTVEDDIERIEYYNGKEEESS